MTPSVRASDAERDEAVRVLQAAAGEGRLTPEEAGERLAQVSAARYRDDLDRLVEDLPDEPLESQEAARPRVYPWLAWRLLRVAAGVTMAVAIWSFVGLHSFWLAWPIAFMAFGLLGGARHRWRRSGPRAGPWGWGPGWTWMEMGPRRRFQR